MIPYGLNALRAIRLVQPTEGLNPEQICLRRGLDMALGGVYDHVAGGFHRYTVDPTWTVPHFEKMLYDNGLIMEYLANLWRQGYHEPAFERAIAGTVQWLKREMWAGYFYAAQDADSFITPDDAEPEEGAFYVWREAELRELLTDSEFAALGADFDISAPGNFEGNIVLQRKQAGQLQAETETAPVVEEKKEEDWSPSIPKLSKIMAIMCWQGFNIAYLKPAKM